MRQPLRALALLALLAVVIIAALTACGTPDAPTTTPTAAAPRVGSSSASPAAPSSSPAAPIITPTATATLVTPSASPSTSPTSVQCFYRSTDYVINQTQSTQFQAALVAANFPNASGEVAEEGENRICSDGTSTFRLRSSSMRVGLPVADLSDREKLGVLLDQILTVAKNHGTSQNKVFVVSFTMGEAREYIMTYQNVWEYARQRGLTGAALLNELQRPR